MTQQPITLLIAEDHEFTRTGLVYSLQAIKNFQIVAEAENGAQAVEMAVQHKPSVVLMDIGMPEMDGITATQKIKAASPEIKVVMLTSRQFNQEIYASLSAGADAYCMKDITTDKVAQVIEMVMEGAMWLDPAIAKIVVNGLPAAGLSTAGSKQAHDGQGLSSIHHRGEAYSSDLTEREIDVLKAIASGKSNKDIADHLSISVNTVKSHVRNLIQKLSVDDRTQAAVKALQEGLI